MSVADQNIARAEQILNYVFNRKELCAEALQMAGPYAYLIVDGVNLTVENNKRLAVRGDVAMAHSLCEKWDTGMLIGIPLPKILQLTSSQPES
jgi:hypothetical protein